MEILSRFFWILKKYISVIYLDSYNTTSEYYFKYAELVITRINVFAKVYIFYRYYVISLYNIMY